MPALCGKQRPTSMCAVPRRTGPRSPNPPSPSFSATVILWIAPVGQTWPQTVQCNWQCPIRKLSTGVHSPSTPPSNHAGWITFVGHTRPHCAHFRQRSRNSSSSTAPGGRITLPAKSRVLRPVIRTNG